ncbi:MAG: hypothetical protein ACXWVT_09930 [Burkholderiaceae bacterium]
MDDHDRRDDAEPPAIQDRRDTGGRWSTVLPLLALALIGLMLVRTCVPSQPPSPLAPPAATAAPAAR